MTGRLTYADGIMMKEYKYAPETFPDLIVGNDHYMFPVIQYKGGQSTMVWPPAFKTADITIPDRAK